MRIPEGPHSMAMMLTAEQVRAALVKRCERAKAQVEKLVTFDARDKSETSGLVFKKGGA